MTDELRAAAESLARLGKAIDSRHGVTLAPVVMIDGAIKVARAYLAMTWRPIATAPRDGTLFLAYAMPQHDLPELYSLCAWSEKGGFCIDELREATHWMELPTRPESHP